MATSDEHHRLTKLGASWFRKNGFSVITTELTCSLSRERPDVLAFREACSALIEVKVSRSDFLADFKKPERTNGGLGVYRFYLCPEGMIKPAELPPKWGLLYATGRAVLDIVRPMGNHWPGLLVSPEGERFVTDWRPFQHTPNERAERSALFSIARRLSTAPKKTNVIA
jgi:hypothetical protein